MANQSLKLIQYGLAIELFDVVFAITFNVHLVTFFIAVVGLVVAALGLRRQVREN